MAWLAQGSLGSLPAVTQEPPLAAIDWSDSHFAHIDWSDCDFAHFEWSVNVTGAITSRREVNQKKQERLTGVAPLKVVKLIAV